MMDRFCKAVEQAKKALLDSFGVTEHFDEVTDKHDLVDVTRCRDCKYYQAYTESGVTKGYGFCVVHGMSPSVEEFYCADGEVKSDALDS